LCLRVSCCCLLRFLLCWTLEINAFLNESYYIHSVVEELSRKQIKINNS
jgi:hypothetical protein